MGVGDSLEASAPLSGPIRAGTWHLVGDGIVLEPADIRYDILWRRDSGDTTLASVRRHFDPLPEPNPFDATRFETDLVGVAAPAKEGDRLVWRFTAEGAPGGGTGSAFIPNGDGDHANGRIPSLRLPR